MGIQALFGNTIINKAAYSLTLSLTPMDELSSVKQKEKIDLICARNRIISALNEECKKVSDPSQRQALQEKIQMITEFYEKIGGETERTTAKLSFFSPTKLIEGPIPGSIIASTKPDMKCSKNELQEKEKQKVLRDQIIETAYQTAQSETVVSRLTELLDLLGYKPTSFAMHT